MLIGAIEFPMPFVGNGQSQYLKQLFLFNFIFDLLLLLIFSYILFKFINLFRLKFRNNFFTQD